MLPAWPDLPYWAPFHHSAWCSACFLLNMLYYTYYLDVVNKNQAHYKARKLRRARERLGSRPPLQSNAESEYIAGTNHPIIWLYGHI